MPTDVKQWEPADITIHIQGRGVVLKEKSLIAVESLSGKVVAVGTEAEALKDQSPGEIRVMSPLRQGIIADYPEAEYMFAELLRRALGKKPLLKPFIAVRVPKGITIVEKKALEDAMFQSGARNVLLFEMPMEQYLREIAEKYPDVSRKYKITIEITKEEPERYVKEALLQVLSYAGQEGIPADRVLELLEDARRER